MFTLLTLNLQHGFLLFNFFKDLSPVFLKTYQKEYLMKKLQINFVKNFILLVQEENTPLLPLSGVITCPERLSPQSCANVLFLVQELCKHLITG